MLKSMTGFGAGTAKADGVQISIELSSVNRKQLDVSLRLPYALAGLEAQVHKIIKERLSRGRIIGTVQLEDGLASFNILAPLLFFFMVTTVMRETTLFVKIRPPEATEVQKLEKKSLVSFIYIGPPTKTALYGTEPRIQLNDSFQSLDTFRQTCFAPIPCRRQCRPSYPP